MILRNCIDLLQFNLAGDLSLQFDNNDATIQEFNVYTNKTFNSYSVEIRKMIAIKDVDIIFLSYDEPNAEENWADLKKKIPGQNVYTE